MEQQFSGSFKYYSHFIIFASFRPHASLFTPSTSPLGINIINSSQTHVECPHSIGSRVSVGCAGTAYALCHAACGFM